jgi:Mg-chelatase subunit ChlD
MRSFKLFISVIAILGIFLVNAQNRNISVFPKVTDFGEVIGWNSPSAAIIVTNNGKKSIKLYSKGYDPHYKLVTPLATLLPGFSDTIYAAYYTSKKGFFNQIIPLYTTASNVPINIQIKGKIKTFAPEAMMECPTFSPGDTDPTQFQLEGVVADFETKLPIPNAVIELTGDETSYFKTTSSEEGSFNQEIPLKLYQINVSAEGYYSVEDFKYLNKNTKALYYELKSVPKETVEARTTIPDKSVEDRLKVERVEVKNNKEVSSTENRSYLPDYKIESQGFTHHQFSPNNVVFLIDVSVSMKDEDKLPLLKTSMKSLIELLREEDYIAILAYSGKVYELIPSTSASYKSILFQAIDSLSIKSITDGVTGLNQAYETALFSFIPNGNNQVILATDGLFNSPDYNERKLYRLIKKYTGLGIKLSVVGFGEDEEAEQLMLKIAKLGSGSYLPITEPKQSKKVLVNEIRNQSKID